MNNEIDVRYIPSIEEMSYDETVRRLSDNTEPEMLSCVNWPEYSYAPEVRLNLAFSDKVLALLYQVREEHVLGSVLDDNGPVWEDSCVEAFIKDPVSDGYYNFEINCIGSKLAAHRLSRTDFEFFTVDKLSQIRSFGSLSHRQTDMVNAAGREWSLVVMIPFSLLGLEDTPRSLNCNFYKCGDKCMRPHYISWSPIRLPKPDFHCPEYFGKINLIKK
ncbi:MAG: hypothetical protein IJN02_11055 [Bacteroidales bacterium]|nr:hypothetical protein [Bacteroidales bacterium]